MGVSGAGKSAIGAALAGELGVPFVDGDDLHPRENIAKMADGIALNDHDRLPWLERVGQTLAAAVHDGAGMVVACSALTRGYRAVISREAPTTIFAMLDARCSMLDARCSMVRLRSCAAISALARGTSCLSRCSSRNWLFSNL
jgi:carbohydrate kinase (thermoresistant glucokinase family)